MNNQNKLGNRRLPTAQLPVALETGIPNAIKAYRMKLKAKIVSLTPVATVEVSFHTKMA